jgi:hypothetical protein
MQGQSGRMQKILPPPEFDPQSIQPVASRYTDYTIPAHRYIYVFNVLEHLNSQIQWKYVTTCSSFVLCLQQLEFME